ncbi:MAG: SWIM zinc finger family protein [Gaiella sp.]
MNTALLDDGRPIFARSSGTGPWARWFATAVVGDESSSRAERGRILARSGHVHSVEIGAGHASARVIGSGDNEYTVTIAADPIASRSWQAVVSSERGASLLAAARAGRPHAVQLEHLLAVDWGAPLVPKARDLRRRCTCPDGAEQDRCKHVAALAYVLADGIDRDFDLLLDWRGCGEITPASGLETAAGAPEQATRPADPWQAGAIPPRRSARPLPPGAVVKRLGRSGITLGGVDLADLLLPAYRALSAAQGEIRR